MRKKAFIILLIASAIMFYPVIKYLYRYFVHDIDAGFLRQLGFFSGPSGPWYAWVLAPIIGFGYAYFTALKVPTIKTNWNEISLFNLFGLVVAFPAAIVEEAVFRRYIIENILTENHYLFQILVSGLIFGIAHGIWGFLKGSLRIAWEASKATTFLGIILGILYVISEKSLAPCIFAHFILTAIIEPWLIVGVMKKN